MRPPDSIFKQEIANAYLYYKNYFTIASNSTNQTFWAFYICKLAFIQRDEPPYDKYEWISTSPILK
jgi:hypothetical protein